MNDIFMYSLREHPEQTFSTDLKKKLDERNLNQAATSSLGRRRLTFGFSFVLVLAVISMALAVPSVRARLQDLIIQIGGQSFLISNEHPLISEAATIQPIVNPIEQITENGVILPAYVPEGFVVEQDQYLSYQVDDAPEGQGDWVEVVWIGPEQNKIVMIVADSETVLAVGTEALEEVTLKGIYPAALFRGGWDNDLHAWNSNIPVSTLAFMKDGKSIRLTGSDSQSLILMAESLYP